MAVSFRSASSSHVASGNLNISMPDSTQAGDVALLFVDGALNTVNLTTPAGWTLINTTTGAPNIKSVAYYRVLGAGESGSAITVVNDAGNIRIVGQIVVYSGVNTSAVVQVQQFAVAQSSSTTKTTPTVSATAAGMLVEHVADRGNPVGTDWTASSGIVERADHRSTTEASVNVSAATGDKAVASAGSEGGHTWTTTTATNHSATWAIVLNEGNAPTTGYSVHEDFESGAPAATITPATTNFTSTDFSGASAVFSATQHIKNSQSALIDIGATTGRAGLLYTLAEPEPTVHLRWYQRVSQLTANTLIGMVSAGATTIAQVRINSDRTLRIYNGQVASATSTQLIALNQWLRFEWRVDTATGNQTLRVFAGNALNSDNVADALMVLNGSCPTADEATVLRVGVTANSSNYTSHYDAFASQSSGWVGADPSADTPHNLVIASAVGVGGVWRPITNVAVGVGGQWRPLTKIGFGQTGQWRPAPAELETPSSNDPLPYFVHMPWQNPDGSGISMAQWPAMLAARKAAGWGTGVALYASGQLTWNAAFANFFAQFPDGVDVFAMPKDPTGAVAFLSNLNDAQRSRIWWSNGQEMEDDAGNSAGRAAFRQRSVDLWNAVGAAGWRWNPATKTGVRCCVEMNGAVTYGGNHGGLAAQVEMVEPSAIDFMGWSAFSPTNGTYGVSVLNSIASAMQQHWPTVPWGWVSGGVAIPANTPLGSATRLSRANNQRLLMQTALNHGSLTLSHYDVWHFSGIDYGWETSIDGGPLTVDAYLNDVLAEFGAG